jgi:hypothetical protein
LAEKIVNHKRNKHTVVFTNEQEAAIKKEAKKLKVSSDEVLRLLVDEFLIEEEHQLKQAVKSGALTKAHLDMPLIPQ